MLCRQQFTIGWMFFSLQSTVMVKWHHYIFQFYMLKSYLKMTILQQISNPYLASLILGLLYGFTFCTSTCLPYVISYIAGIGAGFRKGFTVALIYNIGRVVAYALLGTVVGLSTVLISEEFLLSYQEYSSIAFGAVIIVVGAIILLRNPVNCSYSPTKKTDSMQFFDKLSKRFDIRAFFMGFTKGLVLCPPLIALLLYAVTFSQIDCTILAVVFGIGTTLSPLLLLSGATGWLLNKAPLFRTWISRIGGVFLVLMGISILFTSALAFT